MNKIETVGTSNSRSQTQNETENGVLRLLHWQIGTSCMWCDLLSLDFKQDAYFCAIFRDFLD